MSVNMSVGGWTVKKNMFYTGNGTTTVGMTSSDDHYRISEGNWLGKDGFEYITLEYLEHRKSISGRSSSIDLGLTFNPSTDKIIVEAQALTISEGLMSLLGTMHGRNQFSLYYNPVDPEEPDMGDNKIWFDYALGNTELGPVDLSKHTFECGEISQADITFASVVLFEGGDISGPFIGRIYSFKMVSNGVITRNLIPVRRYNAKTEEIEYGMYDNITETFYGDTTNNRCFSGPRKLDGIYNFYNEVDLMGGYTYRELESIESTGDQYVDTEVTFSQSDLLTIELDIKLKEETRSDWGTLFGVSVNNSGDLTTSGQPLSLWFDHANNRLAKYINGSIEYASVTYDRQTISIDTTGMSWGSNKTLYLFDINYDRLSSSYHRCPFILYGCKIYKNSQKIRDYVPVARAKTNSVPLYDYGLYDLENKKYYRNIGYNDFIPGQAAAVNRLLQKRTLYRRLDYIRSDGTNYLETNFKVNSNTKISADISADIVPQTGREVKFIFGGFGISGLGLYRVTGVETEFGTWIACSGGKSKDGCGEIVEEEKINVSLANDIAIIKGTSYTLTNNGEPNNKNFVLFGTNVEEVDDPSEYNGIGKIYYIEIINDNDGKNHLLIPVRTGEGKLGFYDSYQMTFMQIPDEYSGFTYKDMEIGSEFVTFYCGDSEPEAAPFRVTNKGNLYAENAVISGNITANSGQIQNGVNIGNLTIQNDSLQTISGDIDFNNENIKIGPCSFAPVERDKCIISTKGPLSIIGEEQGTTQSSITLMASGGDFAVTKMNCSYSQYYTGHPQEFGPDYYNFSIKLQVDGLNNVIRDVKYYISLTIYNSNEVAVGHYTSSRQLITGSKNEYLFKISSIPDVGGEFATWNAVIYGYSVDDEAWLAMFRSIKYNWTDADVPSFKQLTDDRSRNYFEIRQALSIGPSILFKGSLLPEDNGVYNLGGPNNNRWNTVYATNGQIQTSYRGSKTNIANLEDKNDILFDALIPRRYKLIKNESDRTHYGFILDEVRDAMDTAGIDPKDFAAYALADPEDPNGDGGLRYSEFIPLNTWQIQKLKSRFAELESKVESLMARIEELKTKNE